MFAVAVTTVVGVAITPVQKVEQNETNNVYGVGVVLYCVCQS